MIKREICKIPGKKTSYLLEGGDLTCHGLLTGYPTSWHISAEVWTTRQQQLHHWELPGNAESQASLYSYWIRICTLTRLPPPVISRHSEGEDRRRASTDFWERLPPQCPPFKQPSYYLPIKIKRERFNDRLELRKYTVSGSHLRKYVRKKTC